MFPTASLHVLGNGLRVVLVPDDHVESAAFGLFVGSGSRHEPKRLAGISHFIEHMLFKGTARRSARDINRAIEGRGGAFNAYTSEESTCFYAHMPQEELELAVDVITDMYLNAALSPDEFARERQVIVQEILMYRDEPDSVASENLSLELFPGNPVGAPIAGSPETLAAMTPQTLKDYIRSHYVPKATVAVVAGRFEPSRALDMVAKRLERLSGAGAPKFVKFKGRPPVAEMRVSRDISQTQLALGYRTPFGADDPRRFAFAVLDTVMGRTMSSRLFESIRERRGLSYDIRSSSQLFAETGAFTVTAGLDPARADAAYAAILREIDRIRSKCPSTAEVARAKEYLLGHFRIAFERTSSRLFYYGPSVLARGRIESPEENVRRLEAVTARDVFEVAREVLVDAGRAVSWVTPKQA